MEPTISVKKKFTITYKELILKISSADQIIFNVEFPDGKQKQLTFELNTDMDVQWKSTSGESTDVNDEIGRLIEKQMLT